MLQILVLSLAQAEIKYGLDALLSLALRMGTQDEDWDQLDALGYSEYEKACILAASAWITRVTGVSEWDRPREKPPQK